MIKTQTTTRKRLPCRRTKKYHQRKNFRRHKKGKSSLSLSFLYFQQNQLTTLSFHSIHSYLFFLLPLPSFILLYLLVLNPVLSFLHQLFYYSYQPLFIIMSELSLSNNSNQYDYMVNIPPTMVQKVSSPNDMNPSPPIAYDDSAHQYACQGNTRKNEKRTCVCRRRSWVVKGSRGGEKG